MRLLAFRPALTMRGRKNKGLRGLAGKPFHPPLTDVPITAYLFAAVFDVLSAALHHSHPDVAARPSEYDRQHAWPWYSYLIVSVRAGQAAELNAWVIPEDQDQFTAEALEIVQE